MTDERKEYFERMKFEHELINRRLTWLLTSEAILFAAYGIAFEHARPLPKVIRFVGLAVCAAVFVGVVASLSAKRLIWKDYQKTPGKENEPFWVNTCITYIAFASDVAFPIFFAWAWMMLPSPS